MHKQYFIVARMPYNVPVDPKVVVTEASAYALDMSINAAKAYKAKPGERLVVWNLGKPSAAFVVGATEDQTYRVENPDWLVTR